MYQQLTSAPLRYDPIRRTNILDRQSVARRDFNGFAEFYDGLATTIRHAPTNFDPTSLTRRGPNRLPGERAIRGGSEKGRAYGSPLPNMSSNMHLRGVRIA